MPDFIPIDPTIVGRVLHQQALTRGTDALTQERILDTRIKADAFARNQNYLAALAQGQQQEQPAPVQQPGQAFPDATSELYQQATGSYPEPVNETPLWQKQAAAADAEDRRVKVAEQFGQSREAELARDNARQYRSDAEKGQRLAMEQDIKRWNDIGQAASLMTDPATFYAGLERAKSLAGKIPLEKFGLVRDLDGSFTPTQQNLQTAAKIANLSMSRKDQLEQDRKDEALVLREQRIEDLRKQEEQLGAYRQQVLELRRQGLAAEAEKIKAQADALDAKMARNKAKDMEDVRTHIQNTVLNKSEPYKNWERIDRANTIANNVASDLAANKGYRELSGPRALALSEAYTQTIRDFRARDPGKWASTELKNAANGALQNLEKWGSTLGTATPILSREGAANVIKSINELYTINTAESFATEVEAARIARRSGGDPGSLASKAYTNANFQKLEKAKFITNVQRDNTGKVTEFTIAGKTYKTKQIQPLGDE